MGLFKPNLYTFRDALAFGFIGLGIGYFGGGALLFNAGYNKAQRETRKEFVEWQSNQFDSQVKGDLEMKYLTTTSSQTVEPRVNDTFWLDQRIDVLLRMKSQLQDKYGQKAK